MNSKSTVLTNVKKILILVSLKPSDLKADLKQSCLFILRGYPPSWKITSCTDTSVDADKVLFHVLKGKLQTAGVWKYICLSFQLSRFLDYICSQTVDKIRTEHKISPMSMYSTCHEKKSHNKEQYILWKALKIKVTSL